MADGELILAGVDIGGTKCAVSIGRVDDGAIQILKKQHFPTTETPQAMLALLVDGLADIQAETNGRLQAVGISCGGPLDSTRGVILSPPNLPEWDRIDVVTPFRNRFEAPVALQNDANACALAEWRWGAGRGCRNLIFLTFGTGMGAGLILDGRLYTGTNDNAGEVGHIRLDETGPIGYGKPGSFEGLCSGGGIARLAQTLVIERLQQGDAPAFCPDWEHLPNVTAKAVGEAAQKGDKLAIEIYHEVGRRLGQGLSILVDILNPERIIIGSIYGRQQMLLEPQMRQILHQEALDNSLSVCQTVPAGLGERVGDYAALSVALHALDAEP